MTADRGRPEGLRDELEGPDTGGYTTAVTGAGGHPERDALDEARRDLAADAEPTPLDNDEAIAAPARSGGGGPGVVAPPPGTDWPDPMGGDDEERELERTR